MPRPAPVTIATLMDETVCDCQLAARPSDRIDAREPVNTNIWEMSHREKRRLRIDDLPHNLEEACNELERDKVITDALGEHITSNFLEAKRQEWQEYITQVSQWELDNYLAKY